MHWEFLGNHGYHADKKVRRLPVNFMERVGLECCLWPHLYWTTAMTETYARSQDERRLQRPSSAHGGPEHRERKPKRNSAADIFGDSDAEEKEPGDAEGGAGEHMKRQSLKASFLAKVMSPLLGYGSDHQLSQFVYDLWMWSRLGGAKNATAGMLPLRLALAGNSFSPEYWKTQHSALLDLQKQLGFPSLFLTIAPYEWAAPYHVFIEHEMEQTLRSRLYLPGAESFHLAHLLTQCITGLVTGTNRQTEGRGDRCWNQHVFANKETGEQNVVNFFCRIEYQDGKRKRVFRTKQDYHGRGTPHVHVLVWLRDMESIDLPSKISAHLPPVGTKLGTIVRAGQLSYKGSGWPQRDEESIYSAEAGLLFLHHDKNDCKSGVRAFMPDVVGAMKCHMDVQMSDGRGMLLRYCAGPKQNRKTRKCTNPDNLF